MVLSILLTNDTFHTAYILKLNCLLGFLTEAEPESGTTLDSCLESIPPLSSISTTVFPELSTRIWSFIPCLILLIWESSPLDLCPSNGSTLHAVFSLQNLHKAIQSAALLSCSNYPTFMTSLGSWDISFASWNS